MAFPKQTKSELWDEIRAIFLYRTLTPDQLVCEAGISRETALRMLRLFKRESMIYIVDWTYGARPQPIYKWGHGKDLPVEKRSKDSFVPRPDIAAAWLFPKAAHREHLSA